MIRILKLKPLSSSVESSGHQFLQQCCVSGTAKGKGKVKVGQPLKRSKVTIKKGAAAAPPKGGGKSENDRREKLYAQCLSAPTPVRHLTPKQKEREAQREKLGLISKDRRRELDMLKKDKGKMGISKTQTIIGTPGLDLISLGIVDEKDIPKYELTVEDGRRLAKEYSRVLMRRHRARQAALSGLLQSKKEAIEALPEHLKAAALVPDYTPFPANRFMATLTPPIEGYAEKMKEAARRSRGTERVR